MRLNEVNATLATVQLRYLQTLSDIATERNSTIIFPLPIDMLRAFGRRLGIFDDPSAEGGDPGGDEGGES